MRELLIGLGFAMVAVVTLQGCASTNAASGQGGSSVSSGSGDGDIVTGSRIPRKAPRPSENVVIKDAGEKTGL
ncbi:hypothetical protein [Roseateles oligotrophus]|uniref:Lipoprotein n=1 Tax=Roseateles oligotrophus TaxID=1769250 RepID=A0ABT2YC67_9BURK|nr:hypothetical protein [Roseateles oligotrophus]MCV2367641.1 hypothetical protein [Roseateles oligotrophus]